MKSLSGGVSVNGIKPFDWETFTSGMNDFYFIAHLLDQVLVGRKDDGRSYQQLLQGVREDAVLEIRIFNCKKERHAARVDGRMMIYQDLEHDQKRNGANVIDRYYELEEGLNYQALHVKEYIAIDEFHHAYVEKCVLYRLIAKGDDRDECKPEAQ